MITVLTTSIRPDALEMVYKSVRRQDFEDWEWIVVSPFKYDKATVWLEDPPKNEGDYYCLNKAWNKGFANAKGELIVNVQDQLWLPPDLLSRFWSHYVADPKGIVTAVGNQYAGLDENGKPQGLLWTDPRIKPEGSFYKVSPSEMEFCVCSIPKQAVIDCGGVDETYDTCPAMGEKEMAFRLGMMGYNTYQDQSIEYRALKHPRLTEDWDDRYWKDTADLFKKNIHDLYEGTRPLNVNCLMRYNKIA